MADQTAIEWCDSTMNPWVGCTKVSTAKTGGGGCDNCYAAVSTPARTMKIAWGPGQPRHRTSASTWHAPVKWNDTPFYECPTCNWRGDSPSTAGTSLTDGLPSCPECDCSDLRPARRRVFCASLADVFDNEVDPEWRRDLFRLIAHTKNLDWLLLTKRIGNAAKMLQETAASFGFDWAAQPWEHVWLGATIVNQEEADRDIPKLLATPARVRFLSMEPLLGPVDLGAHLESRDAPGPDGTFSDRYGFNGRLHWVIVGGESGHHARPMHPNWARSLRDQCATAGVPYLFKQWGEWIGGDQTGVDVLGTDEARPGAPREYSVRMGKKAAGRLLDGRTHDGFPGVANG